MDFMIQQSLKLVESGKLPDPVIRAGIRSFKQKTPGTGRTLRPGTGGTALYGCAAYAEKQRDCHRDRQSQ